MGDIPTVEGFLDYTPVAAGKPCQTWYKIYGSLKSGVRPLVVVHGGPGLSHDYMDTVADLAAPPHNLPVVFYDQIGGGRSTKLPEKYRDYGFWNEQLFLDELAALLSHLGIQGSYDLLGNSWGGMLSSVHAARQPQGLKRLVLSGTPSSAAAWCKAYQKYREQMPEPHRSILKQPRDFDTEDTPEYIEAIGLFFNRHVVNVDPIPEGFLKSLDFLEKDPTVAHST
jgi:proline-specific peptidase